MVKIAGAEPARTQSTMAWPDIPIGSDQGQGPVCLPG